MNSLGLGLDLGNSLDQRKERAHAHSYTGCRASKKEQAAYT